jgi:hypothetical protein
VLSILSAASTLSVMAWRGRRSIAR